MSSEAVFNGTFNDADNSIEVVISNESPDRTLTVDEFKIKLKGK